MRSKLTKSHVSPSPAMAWKPNAIFSSSAIFLHLTLCLDRTSVNFPTRTRQLFVSGAAQTSRLMRSKRSEAAAKRSNQTPMRSKLDQNDLNYPHTSGCREVCYTRGNGQVFQLPQQPLCQTPRPVTPSHRRLDRSNHPSYSTFMNTDSSPIGEEDEFCIKVFLKGRHFLVLGFHSDGNRSDVPSKSH